MILSFGFNDDQLIPEADGSVLARTRHTSNVGLMWKYTSQKWVENAEVRSSSFRRHTASDPEWLHFFYRF